MLRPSSQALYRVARQQLPNRFKAIEDWGRVDVSLNPQLPSGDGPHWVELVLQQHASTQTTPSAALTASHSEESLSADDDAHAAEDQP